MSLLLLLQATRSRSIWRGLEELQVNILVRTNILRCSCVSNLFTSWHCLLKSWSIVHGYLLSTYSCGIGVVLSAVGSGWSRLYCQLFSRAQLLELWHGGFRSPIGVACESYLVKSRRPLWFRSSQANLSLSGFNTPALSVGGSVMQHVNNQSPSC